MAGITSVSDAVGAARAAMFASSHARTLTEYKAAVDAAVAAVATALETAAREAERLKAADMLEDAEKRMRAVEASAAEFGFLSAKPDYAPALTDCANAIDSARATCATGTVPAIQALVADACARVTALEDMLKRDIAEKKKAEKAKFNKLLGMWGQKDETNLAGAGGKAALPPGMRKGALATGGAPKPLFKTLLNKRVSDGAAALDQPAAAAPAPASSKFAGLGGGAPLFGVKRGSVAGPSKFSSGPSKFASASPAANTPPPAPAAGASPESGGALRVWCDENGLDDAAATALLSLASETDDLEHITDADLAGLTLNSSEDAKLRRALAKLGAKITTPPDEEGLLESAGSGRWRARSDAKAKAGAPAADVPYVPPYAAPSASLPSAGLSAPVPQPEDVDGAQFGFNAEVRQIGEAFVRMFEKTGAGAGATFLVGYKNRTGKTVALTLDFSTSENLVIAKPAPVAPGSMIVTKTVAVGQALSIELKLADGASDYTLAWGMESKFI